MSVGAFDNPSDLLYFVKRIANNLSALRFSESAAELTAWSNGAWTTSSEFLGELGLCCRHILKRDRKRLPPGLCQDIERCLKASRERM